MILVKPSFNVERCDPGDEVLGLIERAGRTCYKSESKITPDSAREFVRKILKSGHHSVIEHSMITVRFIIDRGVSHELVRHRLAAFSQESTRYCNYAGGVTFVIPPWVNVEPGNYPDPDLGETDIEFEWVNFMRQAETMYLDLLQAGWSPQQARSVLPNSLKTEVVMTANVREWRHVFSLRCSKAAHPQMREVMIPLLGALFSRIPVLFDDLAEEYPDHA
ncbi:MAG: FAD-dependent thymidylate synthase [Proteobacteria bacterium]|nr:FAD-dependent thymidylate synthase [Pseudomonadota bacterium]